MWILLCSLFSEPVVAAPARPSAPDVIIKDPKKRQNGERQRARGRKSPRPLAKIAESGNMRVQMIAAKMDYNDHPGDINKAIKYAQSLARYGLCEQLLDVMGPIWDEPEVQVGMVYSMAQCAARIGLYNDAIYYDLAALEMDDSRVRGLSLLAIHADAVGDVAQREAAISELAGLNINGGEPTLLAEATLALRRGDADALDVCLALWERGGWQKQDAEWLNAQMWLDLDDPLETLEMTGKIRSNRQSGRYIYAEAYRRIGEFPTTISKLENINMRVAQGVNADAILARAYTDAGDLAHAHELLLEYEGSMDIELIASRWYLARAEKNEAAVKQEAALWAQVSDNQHRKLEQLIPW